jgi:putative NIF3 family GTP cyclohydrolase 1 type 2
MKLGDIYNFAVKRGIAYDPRGKAYVERELNKVKKKYEKLSPEGKKEFDREKFRNPYGDTRILYGDGKEKIRSILVGIDTDAAEILLANYLSRKGRKIDLVLSHHPGGRALANLYEVMNMQAEIFRQYGVPINVAEGIMEPRVKEVERKLLPVNHRRAIDAARLVNIPLMCVHTPADNAVTNYLRNIFKKEKFDKLGDVLSRLKDIPEYKMSLKENAGPKIILGSPEKSAGRIMVDMTGGTEGAEKLLEKFAQAGIGTMVCMHMSEKHFGEARKSHLNIIIAGHIASDTLGLNLILDDLDPKRKLNIIPCSGFTRIKR